MITHLEIDGFKSFADFSVDIPPFVAIVGPNGSGKSNLFDALAFLGRLVRPLYVEQALDGGRGEWLEQFRLRGDGQRVGSMRLAADLLIDRDAKDGFGSAALITHTRLRYEIVIERRPDRFGGDRPYVAEESVTLIPEAEDALSEQVSSSFARQHLLYGANQDPLTTETRDDGKVFRVARTPEKPLLPPDFLLLPADKAMSSVLETVTRADEFPLLFAVRRELAGWRSLHLEPSALRTPSGRDALGHLDVTGKNLAWTLESIRRAEDVDDAPGLDALAVDLARVIPGFRSVRATYYEPLRQWEVELESREEGVFSARTASDGTLRLIALLAALYEPTPPGVLCLEEPENGINPRRLTTLVEVLRQLVTDPQGQGDPSGLVQLIISSHSPLLPLRMAPAELLVVDTVSLIEGPPGVSRITRVRRILREGEQVLLDGEGWAPWPTDERERLSGITPQDAQRLIDAR